MSPLMITKKIISAKVVIGSFCKRTTKYNFDSARNNGLKEARDIDNKIIISD